MSDEDYNALKAELKAKASVVAAEGPRCSLRSKASAGNLRALCYSFSVVPLGLHISPLERNSYSLCAIDLSAICIPTVPVLT